MYKTQAQAIRAANDALKTLGRYYAKRWAVDAYNPAGSTEWVIRLSNGPVSVYESSIDIHRKAYWAMIASDIDQENSGDSGWTPTRTQYAGSAEAAIDLARMEFDKYVISQRDRFDRVEKYLRDRL